MSAQAAAITVKTAAEIELMDAAGRVVEETLRLLRELARPGVTTAELDREAERFIRSRGATPSFLHYHGYPRSICTSVNEQVVHGIPGQYRLRDGDILSVDVGAQLNGFHGDAARTYCIGSVPEAVRALVRVTRECFFEGLRHARAGMRIGDISAAVQAHAEAHGYGVVREMIGHGIGRDMHEPPDVPNYGRAGHGPRHGAHPAKGGRMDDRSGGWQALRALREHRRHYGRGAASAHAARGGHPMTQQAALGRVAISRAGRDRGRAFLIVGVADEAHVLLADGATRRLARPKKKKLMHLRIEPARADEIAKRLESGAALLDADIRKALSALGYDREEQEG